MQCIVSLAGLIITAPLTQTPPFPKTEKCKNRRCSLAFGPRPSDHTTRTTMTNAYTRDGDTDPQPSPASLAAGYTDPYHKSLTSNLDATLKETLARVSDVFGTVGGTTALL